MATNNALNNQSAPFTVTAGDLTISAGNFIIPDTVVGGTSGKITVGGNIYFNNFGTGGSNTFWGSGSGNINVLNTGGGNNGFGAGVLQFIQSGSQNTGMGHVALQSVTTSSNNTGIGGGAGNSLSTGGNNTLIGYQTGQFVTTASGNTALGYQAGNSWAAGSANNICIGNVGASESNTMRIGTAGSGAGQVTTTYIAGPTMNIATDASASVITIGNNTSTTSVALNNGSGTISIGLTPGTGAVNIGNTTGNTSVTGTLTTSAGITTTNGSITVGTTTASAAANVFQLNKSRSGGVITTGDTLGALWFNGFDGSAYSTGAEIKSVSSGTIGASRIPANLTFATKPDSATVLTTRMTIATTGAVTIASPDSGVGLTISGGGLTVTGTTTLNTALGVASGGTGLATLTAHNVLLGEGTSSVAFAAPSATSGVPLISQGASSDPVFGTAVVAGGGTGATSLTGLVLGNGTSAMTAITYTDWTSWTPTLIGGTVAGTTSYTTQFGQYTQIGNTVIVMWNINATPGATATGNLTIGGLPLTVSSTTSYIPYGTVTINSSGTAWPASTTSLAARGAPGGTTIAIETCGSATASGFIQVANTAVVTKGTLIYHV